MGTIHVSIHTQKPWSGLAAITAESFEIEMSTFLREWGP